MNAKLSSLLISFLPFLFCSSTNQEFISDEMLQWLNNEAKNQLSGCLITAHDGTVLYTPDGEGNYPALWTRDFSYMVENTIELIPNENVKKAILYLLQGQREDHCMPDRVQTDGLAVYCAGPVTKPLGDPPTDNTQFMVKLVADYVHHTKNPDFFRQVSKQLEAAMDYTPHSENGLVFINPSNPHSPYGFTDTIQKTGELLFSSLLYWEACQKLVQLFMEIENKDAAQEFKSRATQIEKNLDELWDDKAGMFRAASIDCRQIDIWGSAYAIYIDYPLGEKKDRIVDFLAKNFDKYVMQGQIRHILEPDYWEKTLVPVTPGEYQNGAYWGTASGWIAFALAKGHAHLTKKIFSDLVAHYQQHGTYECINKDYAKLDNYVASVVNPLGAIKRLHAENQCFKK